MANSFEKIMSSVINKEFEKIRGSFSRVKQDLMHISSQVHDAYNDMLKRHDALASEVHFLSSQIKGHNKTLHEEKDSYSKNQVQALKTTIRDLKKEISDLHKDHSQFSIELEDVKKRKVEARELSGLQEKMHTTELEVFLLKERMLEKDVELKKLKEMNKSLFELVEDLSKVEMNVLQSSHSHSMHH